MRILELIIPSFGFALVYLLSGLIPGIIAHTLYDIFLYSLPLFVAGSQGLWLSRCIIILFCAIPLLIVFASRLITKRWIEVPAAFLNGAWQPATEDTVLEQDRTTTVIGAAKPFTLRKLLLILFVGCLSFISWALNTSFTQLIPPLVTTKSEAQTISTHFLATKAPTFTNYTLIPSTTFTDDPQTAQQHRYVWQKFGKTYYKELLGTYLTPPLWKMRATRFSGDLQQRAEEYTLFINGRGKIIAYPILSLKQLQENGLMRKLLALLF